MSCEGASDARAEAERLVAAALAAASTAARGMGHLATGSGECCVCPVCRGIAALREPSPEFSERLASAAGDLAEGVASVLRAFGTATCAPAGEAATAGDSGKAQAAATGEAATAGDSQAEGQA